MFFFLAAKHHNHSLILMRGSSYIPYCSEVEHNVFEGDGSSVAAFNQLKASVHMMGIKRNPLLTMVSLVLVLLSVSHTTCELL